MAIGIYLTIWTKVYREIQEKSDCSTKIMAFIEGVSLAAGAGYFLFALIEPFAGKDSVLGAYNIVKYYTFSYLLFLLGGFIYTGVLLIRNIRRAS